MKILRRAIFRPIDDAIDNAPQWAKTITNRRTVFIAVVLLIFWVGYLVLFRDFKISNWPRWTLFDQTLWEWMGLLIIPIVLAVGGFLLQRSERNTDRELAKQRHATELEMAREARLDKTLDDYLQDLKELILKDGLLETENDDPKREMARTLTLTTIRRLDGERNRTVFEFLQEVGAIKKDNPIVSFDKAELNDVNLPEANLQEANLEGAQLMGADLRKANLIRANLAQANLFKAKLNDADLWRADLQKASILGAQVRRTNLMGADLRSAILAKSDLLHATMPDGTKYGEDTDLRKFTHPDNWAAE